MLAIAALRLGAAAAWAVDLDPQALTASHDNARLNDIEDRLWIGSPTQLPDLEVDILVANILADPLQELALRFHDFVVPGGHIVLSGILSRQSNAARDAYSAGCSARSPNGTRTAGSVYLHPEPDYARCAPIPVANTDDYAVEPIECILGYRAHAFYTLPRLSDDF